MTYVAAVLIGLGLALLAYLLARRLQARPRANRPGVPGIPLSRRDALRLGAAGAASLAAGSAGVVVSRGPDGGRFVPGATGAPLTQPAVLDVPGSVDLTLGRGASVAGRPTSALSYNGATPTLRVRPGEKITVRLKNGLAEPTNLHTHGLRVSPSGNSDNPFVRVGPGETFEYEIAIPDDHPAGTFWYHPHHHGNAADQQYGGLAGALLVVPKGTGAGKPAADVPVGSDLVFLVSDITLRADGTPAPASDGDSELGREGDLVLVNGQLRPVLAAAPGSTARWRIVNACTSRVLVLRLDGHKLTQIALDGSFLPAPDERDTVILSPGNRADVVVRAGSPGTYSLTSEPYDRGAIGTRRTLGKPVVLATLAVAGDPVDAPALPTRLPGAPVPPPAPTRTRQVEFTMRMGGGHMTFGIDDRKFDPDRDDQTAEFGTTEDWFVNNDGPMVHPFHLHAWPFTVLASSDGTPPAGVLQDVVLVPARGWTRIRVSFTGYPGRSVFHCHVVDHSDAGMMATLVVE